MSEVLQEMQISEVSGLLRQVAAAKNLDFDHFSHIETGERPKFKETSNSNVVKDIKQKSIHKLWIEDFEKKLDKVCGRPNLMRISGVCDLEQLLKFYYKQIIPSSEMFPYLHGMRSFYSRHEVDVGESQGDVFVSPSMREHLHLMFIDTNKSRTQLINLCKLKDILKQKNEDGECGGPKADRVSSCYQQLDWVTKPEFSHGISFRRNYGRQKQLMALISNFVLYNDSNQFSSNLDAALILNDLSENNHIYIVDIPQCHWGHIDSRFCVQLPRKCNEYFIEQSLIFELHGMKNPFPNIYIGTVCDFQGIDIKNTDFSLIIHCSTTRSFPSLECLKRCLIRSDSEEPSIISFPGSGSVDWDFLPYDHMLSLMNTLKVVYRYATKENRKVFIFLYDGFTGLSFLMIALACLIKNEGHSVSLEDSILQLMNAASESSFFFFDRDYKFLKKFEKFLSYLKLWKSRDNKLISTLSSSEIQLCHHKHYVPQEQNDWFGRDSDKNFPSKILPNFYLGTVAHASSKTILRHYNIKKIISIYHKPTWLNETNIVFAHEIYQDNLNLNLDEKIVIKPIYTFSDNDSHVYEINGLSSPECPSLDLFIYISGIRDDGIDSMLALLSDCPSEIQAKILYNPEEGTRTLIHCMLGVSRSATLAIALMMKNCHMSLLDAYMHVRVRRLNIIIQPNLRLFYDLYHFEKHLRAGNGICWWALCDFVFNLNRYYILN